MRFVEDGFILLIQEWGGPSKRSKRKEEKGREDSMILGIEGEIGKKS